jgi:hypothetical protein
MDATRCIVCNTKHWSRQPCPAMSREPRDIFRRAEGVTKNPQLPVTKIAGDSVTKIPAVMKTKRGRPRLGDKPMTAAERMRRYRASKAPLP